MGCRKAAAFGVKEDEMIGEIGGKWYEVFEVKCMKGLASYKVSSTDACLQNLAECLESPRVLDHLRLHNFAPKTNDSSTLYLPRFGLFQIFLTTIFALKLLSSCRFCLQSPNPTHTVLNKLLKYWWAQIKLMLGNREKPLEVELAWAMLLTILVKRLLLMPLLTSKFGLG